MAESKGLMKDEKKDQTSGHQLAENSEYLWDIHLDMMTVTKTAARSGTSLAYKMVNWMVWNWVVKSVSSTGYQWVEMKVGRKGSLSGKRLAGQTAGKLEKIWAEMLGLMSGNMWVAAWVGKSAMSLGHQKEWS